MHLISRPSATVLLLAGSLVAGCAQMRTATPRNDNIGPAGEPPPVAQTMKNEQVSSPQSAHRTREEVHAEAVEAAKHHVATLEEEREFFER